MGLARIRDWFVHQRQINRVAIATHPAALNIRIVFGLDRERIVHWVSNNFFVFEWTKQFCWITGREIACDLILEKIDEWNFIFYDSVASHATNAITGQSSIDVPVLIARRWIRIVSCIHQITIEIAFIRSTVIVIQTALAHYAMTLETGIVD